MAWSDFIIKLNIRLIKYMARGGRGRRGGGPDYMDIVDMHIAVMQELLMVNSGMLTSTGT